MSSELTAVVTEEVQALQEKGALEEVPSQSTVCRTEKEWQDAPSDRPAGIEPVCAIPPFQNGRYRHAARAIDKERFYGESGLHRRIPVHASASNPPSLPDGAVAKSAVPICGCPVWPGICSTAVHQAPSTGDHLPPPTECMSGRVPGRYSDYGRIISGGVAACGQPHSSVAGPGLPGELQQVRAAAGTSGGVSGLPGQFNSHDIRTPHGQGPSDVDNLPELNCPATEYGSTTCQHSGTAVLSSTRDSSHQPAFERPGISAGISPTPASTMGGDRPAMCSRTGLFWTWSKILHTFAYFHDTTSCARSAHIQIQCCQQMTACNKKIGQKVKHARPAQPDLLDPRRCARLEGREY